MYNTTNLYVITICNTIILITIDRVVIRIEYRKSKDF